MGKCVRGGAHSDSHRLIPEVKVVQDATPHGRLPIPLSWALDSVLRCGAGGSYARADYAAEVWRRAFGWKISFSACGTALSGNKDPSSRRVVVQMDLVVEICPRNRDPLIQKQHVPLNFQRLAETH